MFFSSLNTGTTIESGRRASDFPAANETVACATSSPWGWFSKGRWVVIKVARVEFEDET
jgi:hypothetical protein